LARIGVEPMKKTLLITIICGIMVAGPAFSQHVQSLSFTPSGSIFQQNDTFNVETFLTYSGYNAYSFVFWLETPVVGAGFFHITSEEHFVPFTNGYTGPNDFDSCDNNYCYTQHDLGGSNNPLILIPPGMYDVERMHFSITNAAPGVYTFLTTTENPRPSIVTDQDFNDNPIPQASFTITVVPEPSTLALLALMGTGAGLLAYRRWRATR
jgi:PEP-CTERM motif